MFSFSDFMKSEFGDSPAPSTSPLEPRLKIGQETAVAPPVCFATPVGERRVPREKDPKKPNYETIKNARQGILSGFLPSGIIFRASDFVGIVNPKTAIITLNDIYDFESRFLTPTEDQTPSSPLLSSRVSFKKTADKEPDDEKTLRNLFYISSAKDELPSFHFWTKPGDVDPVTVGEPIEWGKALQNTLASSPAIAKLVMPDKKGKEKGQYAVEGQQNTQKKHSLGFLDRDNDTDLPDSERKPIQKHFASEINPISEPPTLMRPPVEAKVLLQFNRGGMYLREFTHKALYAMACWLIKNEEEDEDDEDEVKDMFLSILEPGTQLREEKIASVSRASNRNFEENIKPIFGRPDHKYWVRSPKHQPLWDIDSGLNSGGAGQSKHNLKLVRPNVGYCYCSANWHHAGSLGLNSWRFEKALEFLFDWELSAYPKSNRLSLDIPGHGSFDLDRKASLVVDANIQKILAELSKIPSDSDSRTAEVFIRDLFEDDTDGSDSLGTSSSKNNNSKNEEDPRDVPYKHQTTFEVDQPIEKDLEKVSSIPYQPPSAIFGKATGIGGASDVPSIHPRAFSVTDIDKLQERLRIAEASATETDNLQERLSVAEKKLSEMNDLKERLKTLENRAKLQSSCPFCSKDWAGSTTQQQQDHLRLHQKSIIHQPAPERCPHPDCNNWLGENQEYSTSEAISEHFRFHIEEEHAADGICEYRYCHTNTYALTGQQQEEHESMHRDNDETSKECSQLLKEVGTLEDTVTERNRLQQQIAQLQDSAKERDQMQTDLFNITEERRILQDRVQELERQLKASPNPSDGLQTKNVEPEKEKEENLNKSNQAEAPKRLSYCNICLKSVDKLSAQAKIKHADKCETGVSEFLLYTPAEAKTERESRKDQQDFVKLQAKKEQEGAQTSDTGKKRKQKISSETIPVESQPDIAGETSTSQQPESSKAASRKNVKRRNDTFKPPKEDESEDEEDEPTRKKPKLKGKATVIDQKTAPTRRSTRGKDIYQPPDEEEDEEKGAEKVYDKPSSSRKGGKKMKKAAASNSISKKAKTNK